MSLICFKTEMAQVIFLFCIKAQNAENIIKNTILNPFAETAVNSLPWSVPFRKIKNMVSIMMLW